MKKVVTVINIINGKSFGPIAFFNMNGETDADVQDRMDEWIEKLEVKALGGIGWGWAARTIFKYKADGTPVYLTDDQTPLVIEETDVYWSLKAEYEITITDKTTEYEAELQEIIDKEATIDQIKAAYDIVDGWTSLNDINITFLKKFFKYLIAYVVKK